MQILYFTRDYTTHDRRYLSALAETEHKIFFLRLERQEDQTEKRPLPSRIENITWIGGQRPFDRRNSRKLLVDLKRVISESKPDLIHAGPVQTSAFLSALTGFHPLVSMSWGYDLLIDTQLTEVNRWITRFTLQHSDVLIGDCSTIREKAIEYGMENENIVTFPWGVDLDHFNYQSKNERDGSSFRLLSTRSWEPIYGTDILANAFVMAARKAPQLHLTMLGGGSQKETLIQIFSEGGVINRVQFPGHVNQAELPKYYHKADLYLAATHSDGTSISLLEAMACGCPVLVSDIPGNLEWVNPGVEGWLFPDGNPHALSQAILDAYSLRAHLQEMGQNARLLVEQRADWNLNFPKLLDAYELAVQIARYRLASGSRQIVDQ